MADIQGSYDDLFTAVPTALAALLALSIVTNVVFLASRLVH